MNQSQRFQLNKNNRYSEFRCHKCDSRLKVEKGQFDNHLYCVKCFSYIRTYTNENDDCCKKRCVPIVLKSQAIVFLTKNVRIWMNYQFSII